MRIEKIETGYRLIRRDSDVYVQSIELSWGDMYFLSKYLQENNTRGEVEDYIRGFGHDEFEKQFETLPEDVLKDEETVKEIIDIVLEIRIDKESLDDIYEALCVVL